MSESRELRNALGRFATGVTVVTALNEGRPHGMTANAFVSVSLDPPLVLVSLGNQSSMHRILPGVGRFGISVLAENQQQLSSYFAGRTGPEPPLRYFHRNGVPLLEGAVAHFVVEVVDVHPAGDHTLYIARVEHFEYRETRPLLFHGGKYGQLGAEKRTPEDDSLLFSIGRFDPPV